MWSVMRARRTASPYLISTLYSRQEPPRHRPRDLCPPSLGMNGVAPTSTSTALVAARGLGCAIHASQIRTRLPRKPKIRPERGAILDPKAVPISGIPAAPAAAALLLIDGALTLLPPQHQILIRGVEVPPW